MTNLTSAMVIGVNVWFAYEAALDGAWPWVALNGVAATLLATVMVTRVLRRLAS